MTVTTRSPADRAQLAPQPAGLGRSARFDEAVRRSAGVALWGALTWVTLLWALGGGVRDLTSVSSALTSTGRLSGLVASVLLLAQIVLIARVPILERSFGQDELLRQHRLVGFTSFNLMVAHIVLITWGYAGGELVQTPATLWDLTWHYPGLLLAVAGTGCLAMTVVTSIKAARRRLRYESWHLLHLYAYLGVGLALPHQLWTGQDFRSSAAATVFWWSAWAVAAAAVLVWRVGLPLWRNVRHWLKVSHVVDEGDGIWSVHFTGRALHRLPVRAGQFLNWRFLDGPEWARGNPYSLSAAPDGKSLRITVQELGDGSRRVASLKPGTRALVEGPYGRLSERPRTQRRLLFVGAGLGVTPLRALAQGMAYEPGEATLLHRWRDAPLFADEFQRMGETRGLRVIDLIGSRRTPDSWFGWNASGADDLSTLRSLVPDVAQRDVYICGPQQWTDRVRATALAAGTPASCIHVETFSW